MRMEVHVHADIPILEGVARKQLEAALSPWLDYLDADVMEDAKSLEPEEPGIEYDEANRMLYLCWTGEIGRSFQKVLESSLEALGPYAEEAVEVDVTFYQDSGEQESQLLFVGPNAQSVHEAQRRCMLEDVSAMLERQFGKESIDEVLVVVNDLFDRDWRDKASQPKKAERAFETYTRTPNRKNLH
jgi:hypothetical protein